jgi:hypothetical protein
MLEAFYPIISVIIGSACIFGLGVVLAVIFLALKMAPVEKYPRITRWAVLIFVGLWSFFFVKFLQPAYYGLIAATSLFLLGWGFLSGTEKHVVWREFFTLSFWFPIRNEHTLAKDGT